ncbi:MAG: TolC family protein [Synergistaceae bacterium]|jgi:outer membrane protein TolC|nr:TolC family protein [Synergistaceae bacterium]
MKRFLFFSVAFLLLFSNSAAADVVSLDRYIEMVKNRNHALQSGVRSVEAAWYGVLASVAYQRPSMEGTVGGSWLTGNTAQGVRAKDITASSGIFRLTHRIDVSGSFTLDEQQQVLYYEIQRADFDEEVNSLISSAEENWWSAVLARENIALQRDVLRQRRENNRVIEEKYRQELVPRLDLIRSEAQVVAAETLVTEAEAQYRNLLAALAALAGGTEVVPVEEPLLVPAFNVDADLEKALQFRPAVRSARLALDRSRVVKKLRAKGLSPTLNAGVSWTPLSDPGTSSSPQKGEMAATLSLTIPLLDGNETKYSTLNADRLTQAAEARLRSVETTTNMNLAIARNNWDRAAALEKDRQRQVERSDEELRITELMYNEGMGAQIDLINAQTENQRVRTDYLDAVQGMYVALVNLRAAAGDYAPDENGNWKEALVRYGKGSEIFNEMESKKLRDHADKSLSTDGSVQENKSTQKRSGAKRKK